MSAEAKVGYRVPSEGDATEACSEHAEAHPEPPRERRAYGHRMPSPSVPGKVPQEDLKRWEEKQAPVTAGTLLGFSSQPAGARDPAHRPPYAGPRDRPTDRGQRPGGKPWGTHRFWKGPLCGDRGAGSSRHPAMSLDTWTKRFSLSVVNGLRHLE